MIFVSLMTLSGKSTVSKHPKADTLYVGIPAKVASDSACPLKKGDVVRVTIIGKTVTVVKETS